jgi:hypothetical protein
MATQDAQVIEVEVRLGAPLDFVFRWCTDYSTEDPGLEGEEFERRILALSSSEAIYEDLDQGPDGGWLWSRWKVSLHPPDHWHGESIGSTRDWSIDYQLRPLGPAETALRIRGIRRPSRLAASHPSLEDVRKNVEQIWESFKRSLESDYARRRDVSGRGAQG